MRLSTPDGAPTPTVTGYELWTGPGLAFGAREGATCPLAALRDDGPTACPAGAFLSPPRPGLTDPPDPGALALDPTMIRLARGRTAAWTVVKSPARVAAAAASTVTEHAAGPYPRREAWTVPRALRVVAGVPVTPARIDLGYGAGRYVTSVGCPAGGWAWKVRVHTGATVLEAHGRAPCRGAAG